MGILTRMGLRESQAAPDLLRENEGLVMSLDDLTERLSELELALEDVNWERLSWQTGQEFSRAGLQKIIDLSRLAFLKNPLVNRAVSLQAMYVWGQGVSISANHPDVDAVVQAFLDDPKNQVELTGHQARTMKEQDLQTEGNIFFAFFTNALTGRTRVRTIPVDEVKDIICNPDDRKDPWYYKRETNPVRVDIPSGAAIPAGTVTTYHPDWRYNPTPRPMTIGGHPVKWDAPVYHVKVGGLSTMRFGVPETYSGLDWARAYKEFLEDWATIVRSYSKFAWQMTAKGGKKGLAAAKTKLGTTMGTAGYDTNPPPVAGSIFAASEGTSLTPIKTAGATTSADDGRRMLLMVAAATGLPESFFGDVSVGNLATAKSLDRPTELKFCDRQTLWADIHTDMLQYVIDQVATAPKGKLSGTWVLNDEMDERHVELEIDPETGEPIDRHIDVDFPPILQHDKASEIEAIVMAATLDGKTPAGTMDLKTVSRMLLNVLGEDDIGELLDELFPDGEDGKVSTEAEEAFIQAVAGLREALKDAA